MSEIIWQPDFTSRYDFRIDLRRDFAKSMISANIPREMQGKMNDVANMELESLGENWRNPYLFHENSPFVTQFYIGHNGVWLSTSHSNIQSLVNGKNDKGHIEYHSHEVNNSRDAYVLMVLFGKWVEYADILRGRNE